MPQSIAAINPTRYMGVEQTLRNASASTGARFDHLVHTAMRESGLNPQAKASTSSATGMFQFIEQTWLGMIKQHGAEHGLGEQAAAIFRDSNGRYKVPDQDMRQEILALRRDTHVSALMAGELTNDNRKTLESRLDRPVSGGELYAAHVLGAGGAAKLISTAEENGQDHAANLFPAAARANKAIFYENGRARSVAEVTAFLTGERQAPASVFAANTPPPAQNYPASYMPARAAYTGNSLAGLSHNAQVLSPHMIAIMASLDMPDATSTKRKETLQETFGLIG